MNATTTPTSKTLIDQYGRRIRKLRLSLTDKCNLRCHYCMPVDASFMDHKSYLSVDEMVTIVSELCNYGLQELRLTGGEPLLRRSFEDIVGKLSKLPLKKIGMTTNAVLLDRHLETLKSNRVHSLNISLDSLRPEVFHKITNGNHLEKVLRNTDLAREMGFHLKINVVAMRGVNDKELFDFVEYSSRTGIEVRFLEVMRIGFARKDQGDQFISALELIERMKKRYTLKPVKMEADSTSFNYSLDNGAKIGFIASESQAFCGQCSRWRLSADGMMRACLLKNDGLVIKGKSRKEREEIFHALLGMKPLMRPAEVTHLMNAIGG